MAEPHFIKCESVPESSPNLNTEELLPVSVEKIKVEPDLAFTDECTEEYSLGLDKEELDIQGNFEFVSETKPLKEEAKSELPEPGPSQENTFEHSAGIKGKISKEQHTTDELTRNINQENNVGNVAELTVHTGQEAHAGTVQSKVSLHKLNVQEHNLASSAIRSYLTEECSKSNFQNHVVPETEDEPVIRGECSSSFAHEIHLPSCMVMDSREKPFQCQECNSSFTRKCDLNRHSVLHSAGQTPRVRQHECKECNKTYTRKSTLQDHLLTHSGERPYQCNKCYRSFSQRSTLRTHMVVHSGEKRHHCKECNKTFARKGTLQDHMVTHSGERPYFCKQCNSSFPQRSTLRSHMLIHSEDKPYNCKVCHSSFTKQSSLRDHMVTHSREKAYQCKECNSTFTWKSSLRKHMVMHSG